MLVISKVIHKTITLLFTYKYKWHLGSIFIFILHTISTLHLFSPLGYNLGQNILAISDNDDFTFPLQKSNDFRGNHFILEKIACVQTHMVTLTSWHNLRINTS